MTAPESEPLPDALSDTPARTERAAHLTWDGMALLRDWDLAVLEDGAL